MRVLDGLAEAFGIPPACIAGYCGQQFIAAICAYGLSVRIYDVFERTILVPTILFEDDRSDIVPNIRYDIQILVGVVYASVSQKAE